MKEWVLFDCVAGVAGLMKEWVLFDCVWRVI